MTAESDGESDTFADIVRGDKLRKAGELERAVEAYLLAAAAVEARPAALSLKLARCYERLGDLTRACEWALAVADIPDSFASWQAAAALLRRHAAASGSTPRRTARLALLGSYTTTQLAPMLQLAAMRIGVKLDVYESDYGQYRQEIIDPQSRLAAFKPDFVVFAVHDGELLLPDYSSVPRQDVEEELTRWTTLWHTAATRLGARVIHYNFVLPDELALGHLDARLPGSRYRMIQSLNTALGDQAGDSVLIVDCERLASALGKGRWLDPRYWHLAKQAVALNALPTLARNTAAVVAADLGLTRKCIVLDLDNTLWGGIIGEDGLLGIRLGGSDGEAYTAFQDYLLRLKGRGIILAVVSKNNEADAKEPFEKHPEMRIKLGDIAIFIANWESKPEQVRIIAESLNIGLDSIAFVDDNPVEREAMRRFAPEVAVVPLPADPSGYIRALSDSLLFESSSFTIEDSKRTEQYRARAESAAQEAGSASLADFHHSLQMQATVAPFNEVDLPRIAQLIGKTNQFNLTTRRHGQAQLRAAMVDSSCVHFSLRLRDRLADYGLVSLLIAFRHGDMLDIDTWLMSCRVIGRTVEGEMLQHLCRRALALGCTTISGTYLPTAKNAMVREIFATFGFDLVGEKDGTTHWHYDLQTKGPIENVFIDSIEPLEVAHVAP